MRKPFFSVVIVTYNRCDFLNATLEILLQQTCTDYEVIVYDNASTDATRQTVASFKDDRIRYLSNKQNIGFPKNIQKAMLTAKGRYIFLLGDDDFILYDDTLEQLKKILAKRKFGILRLNIVERNYYGDGLQKKLIRLHEDRSIAPQATIEKILAFYQTVDMGMMSGIIFRNERITPDMFIDCETYPWFKIVIDHTRKYGAHFLSRYYMVITWTTVTNRQPSWIVKNNRLEFETYDRELFMVIPKEKRQTFIRTYYKHFIWLLPCIKMYSTNRNVVRFVRRLIQLQPGFTTDITLWLLLITAIIVPKFIWVNVRLIYHRITNTIDSIPDAEAINARYSYLFHRYYTFIKR